MRSTRLTPTTVHWQENLRQFRNKSRLLLPREHQIAVALLL